MSLNLVILQGNLGKEPEVSTTTNGTSVAKLSVATSMRFKDRSGEVKEVTEWHVVRVWRQSADYIGKFGHKGAVVYVRGSLKTDSWEGSDGVKHYQTVVEADEIKLLGGRDDQPSSQSRNDRGQQNARPAQNDLEPAPDDLPF